MIDLERARHFLKVRHDGILATIKRDGRPQLSNVLYFVDDDGRVRISVTQTRAKTHNLRRDPRASFHVQGRDRYEYLVAAGRRGSPSARRRRAAARFASIGCAHIGSEQDRLRRSRRPNASRFEFSWPGPSSTPKGAPTSAACGGRLLPTSAACGGRLRR